MTKNRLAIAALAGVAAMAPAAHGQTAAKPSAYTGVSQPPPDDTITVDAATTNAKLVARPAAAPAANTVAAASAPAVSVTPATVNPAALSNSAANWKPDYGIVGDTGPVANDTVVPKKAVVAADADADIVTAVPLRPGELPEGTVVRMALDQQLSTGESQAGSDFTGKVTRDVLFDGRVVIPQGSQVLGKVEHVTEGRRFGSPATIRLRPDVVVLPDGSRYLLRAQVTDTSSKAKVDGEGTLKPASRLRTNVIEETAGIGTGAVAGALIGGGPGALVGTLIGAGVMTTHILVQHPASVTVPKDSTLTLSLTEPMSITPEQTN